MSYIDPAASIGDQRGVTFSSDTAGLTANGTGEWIGAVGIGGRIFCAVTNTGTGTCDFALNGTFDLAAVAGSSSPIAAVRFSKLGSTGALTDVVVDSLSGNATTFYEVLDRYPTMQTKIANAAGTFSVAVKWYYIQSA